MALAYGRLKAFDDAYIIASIHDELLVECAEGDAEAVAKVLEAAMLEAADEIVNADEPRVKSRGRRGHQPTVDKGLGEILWLDLEGPRRLEAGFSPEPHVGVK